MRQKPYYQVGDIISRWNSSRYFNYDVDNATTTYLKEEIELSVEDIQVPLIKGDFKVLDDNVSFYKQPSSKLIVEAIKKNDLVCQICDKPAKTVKHIIFKVNDEVDASYLIDPYCSDDCKLYKIMKDTPS